MNIEDLKVSDVNILNVNDSIKAPLLKLRVKVNSSTIIPISNLLEIYVDKSITETDKRKTYVFSLNESMKVNDEFIIEPVFNEEQIELKSYVKRSDGTKEEVVGEGIMMFEGVNYISTNYINALIEVVYPKNIDLVNYFLNNAIYGINNKNKVLTMDDIYFKDAFTLVDEGVNANFNQLKTNCISSNNGTFKLDAMGNLEVESIIVKGETSTSDKIDFDSIYPVGSIYMTTVNVNPTSLFGGSWVSFGAGRCLVGVDANQEEFSTVEKTGGEKAHKLTLNELPPQVIVSDDKDIDKKWCTGAWSDYPAYNYPTTSLDRTTRGCNKVHNNLQPYITCYMWKRTA